MKNEEMLAIHDVAKPISHFSFLISHLANKMSVCTTAVE